MTVGFPVKQDYATGDVLTAANLNDLAGTVNTIEAPLGYAAGKNKIINGDFNINQRAFTSTTTNAAFTFDRFNTNATDGTTTFSAQTFTLGSEPLAGYNAVNYVRIETTGQTLTTALSSLAQKVEAVRTFAGETVTMSFYAKASSGTPNITAFAAQNFGSGGSSIVFTGSTKKAITTSWAKYSFTIAVPSISGKTVGAGDHIRFDVCVSAGSGRNAYTDSLGIQTGTFDIWGVQVEAGSVATEFQTATGTIQGELAACQRYFYRHVSGNNKAIMTAAAYSSTVIAGTVFFKTEMRTAPTLTVPNVATYFSFNANSTFKYASTLSLQEASPNAGTVFGTFEATTAGFAGYVITSNASSFVDFGAEL